MWQTRGELTCSEPSERLNGPPQTGVINETSVERFRLSTMANNSLSYSETTGEKALRLKSLFTWVTVCSVRGTSSPWRRGEKNEHIVYLVFTSVILTTKPPCANKCCSEVSWLFFFLTLLMLRHTHWFSPVTCLSMINHFFMFKRSIVQGLPSVDNCSLKAGPKFALMCFLSCVGLCKPFTQGKFETYTQSWKYLPVLHGSQSEVKF